MNENDVTARVRAVMASVFRVPAEQLPDEPSQATLKAWDSLAHLRLILALESNLKTKFRSDRIPHLTSLQAIVTEVATHDG